MHRVVAVTPWMSRVTLAGAELEGLRVEQPAASVRVLLPLAAGELNIPRWNGNEFLLPNGERPTIRTFTPRRVDSSSGELDVEIVLHGEGAASAWATTARPGDPVAVSGPGRGYVIDDDAPEFVLAGDETAIPAIGQLLEALPRDTPVHIAIEVAHGDARQPLPEHSHATVQWLDLAPGAPPGDALFDAVRTARIAPDARVWVAGEAAAMQRIRRHLFEERNIARTQTAVRGYWKRGRSADTAEEA